MNISFRLYFEDKTITVPLNSLKGNDGLYCGEINEVKFEWNITPFLNGNFVELAVSSDKSLGIKRIDSVVFDVEKPKNKPRFSFYTNNMYNGETRFIDEVGINREYCADIIALYDDFSSSGVTLAGIIPFENPFGAGEKTKPDGSIEFFAKTEYTIAKSMETSLKTEKVFFSDSMTVEELYTFYREQLPQSSFSMPKLTGWNTWDYYLDRVKPEDIFENVDALSKMPFADKLDYIVLDDGWQKEWGVWRENDKFSCGLNTVAAKINDAGFKAGIWMAPLASTKGSSLVNEHPDWFCRNTDGSFYCPDFLYLDPTIPEVEEFILNNYRYQYKAGFRLFKIDYLAALTKVRIFHDKNATGYSILRKLMKKVIEVTGDDVVILGCSLPVQCGADIAPAMRIGVDIHNHWSHVYWIAESLKYTWMYNNKVTRIDPDFLVVRGEETANEPLVWEGEFNDFTPPQKAEEKDGDCFKRHWRHGNQFNAIEAETWANLVAVVGGNIFLSDRMSVLNERGISIIKNAFDITGNIGKPRHLKTDERRPSVWESERSIVVINWTDSINTITVPDVMHKLESNKPFDLSNNILTVTLKPHESFAAVYK